MRDQKRKDMDFAVEIKTYRSQLNMTQRELADALGVTRNTVNRWEMGIKNPRAETLRRIQNMAEGKGDDQG